MKSSRDQRKLFGKKCIIIPSKMIKVLICKRKKKSRFASFLRAKFKSKTCELRSPALCKSTGTDFNYFKIGPSAPIPSPSGTNENPTCHLSTHVPSPKTQGIEQLGHSFSSRKKLSRDLRP